MKRSDVLLVLFSLLLFNPSIEAKQYKIMTENFAPFGYIENDNLTGLSVEIVREILKLTSQPDNIQVHPWARVYREAQQGPNKIVFSMARSPDRETLFKWVGPLIADNIYFYKRKGSNSRIETLEDAKRVNKIMLTRDFPEHKFLHSRGFTNLTLTVRPIQTFKMLIAQRGELVPMGELAALNTIKEAGINPSLIERTNVKLFETKLYIAFSKDISDNEVNKWQMALDQLKTSGKYANILKKYTLQ